MAYSDTVLLVTNDSLPELTLTLKDKNTAASGQVLDEDNSDTWEPVDLTGATVRFRVRPIGSTTLTATLVCTVTDATNGKVVTNFPTGTLTTAGNYEGEIEITYSTGAMQSVYDLIRFKVRSEFG
jgi:hypothetical protein